jgi:hypothetical protein
MFNSHQDKYFDDCPICQTLKRAEEQGRVPELGEMMRAFEKAKEQGAIVGTGLDLI